MPYRFPKVQFDRTEYLSLNEAFHMVGCFQFPNDWTGLEIAACEEISPEGLRATKDELDEKAAIAQKEVSNLSLEYYGGHDQETRDQLATLLEAAKTEHALAKIAHSEFIRSIGYRIHDAEAFARRQTVETLLCRAIYNQELDTHLGFGTVVSSLPDWAKNPKFRVSFSHSYIVTAENLGGRHKHRAYFEKTDFSHWVADMENSVSSFQTDDIAERIFNWFLIFRERCLKEGTKVTQELALSKCEAQLGQADLSEPFKHVWALLKKKEMQQLGRPKKEM